MRPFFCYYGGKWMLAKRYGPPQRPHVIEPFAGGAGYSTYWEPKNVTLIELDPVVYGVWKFLQRVSPAEVMRLPSNVSDVDELPSWVRDEPKWLIGFWFNSGLAKPAVRRSNWARTPSMARRYWSETIKLRIASQVDRIRHWKIIEGTYQDAPYIDAHWHIDPPYDNVAGDSYTCKDIDYRSLAQWCRNRWGFVQVCENDGATWLPFKPFSIVNTCRARSYSVEAIREFENLKPFARRRRPSRSRRARGVRVATRVRHRTHLLRRQRAQNRRMV
jgi:hypothetical protein